ncbi:Stf0 family sulfotransferase [Mesorhizobium sp. UC22_110]|uniref:Stf0 family sulfotransferase n=1 Tax=Mesorhizobium sp. UC22_110 TaxID=3374552 RepID=UPI00375636E1
MGTRSAGVVRGLEEDDASWVNFFKLRAIEPLRLTYETMSADPQLALSNVLSALGRDPELARTIRAGTARLADATSSEWVARYGRETGRTA